MGVKTLVIQIIQYPYNLALKASITEIPVHLHLTCVEVFVILTQFILTLPHDESAFYVDGIGESDQGYPVGTLGRKRS